MDKRGLKKLSPGVYTDGEGALHVDAVELLVANGYEPTKENQDMLASAGLKLMRHEGVEYVVHDDEGGRR